MQGAGGCVGRPPCADLQPLLAVSVWRPVQRELLQTPLPPTRTFLRHSSHNCTQLPSLRLLLSSPSPLAAEDSETTSELVPPWLEVEIDQLLFQREEEQQQRHVLCGWGGNGTLPFHFGQSYSLFIQARVLFSLHPSKDNSTCTRMR